MKKHRIILAFLAMLLLIAGGCQKEHENGEKPDVTGSGIEPMATPTPTPTATATPSPEPGVPVPEAYTGFRITFLSTGKSDCIIIEDNGTVIMNDTADADDYSLIEDYLAEHAIDAIDCLIISHFDKDHIGSASALINNGYVRSVMIPHYSDNSNAWKGLMVSLESSGIPCTDVQDTLTIDIPDGKIMVNPTETAYFEDVNNYSLITTVFIGDKRILLPGDAMKKRIQEFTGSEDYLTEYDIIKSPHHGDYNKKLGDLIKRSSARYLVITNDPKDDRAEADLVRTAQRCGAELLYTREGNIVFEFENGDLVLR